MCVHIFVGVKGKKMLMLCLSYQALFYFVLMHKMCIYMHVCLLSYRCQPPADKRFGTHGAGLRKRGRSGHTAPGVGGQGTQLDSSHLYQQKHLLIFFSPSYKVRTIFQAFRKVKTKQLSVLTSVLWSDLHYSLSRHLSVTRHLAHSCSPQEISVSQATE